MLNFFVPNSKNHYKPYLLRNSALLVYTAFLVLINSFGGLIGISDVHASSITPANIISLTNVQRQKYGLNSLKTNSQLTSAALAKANNMLKVDYWNHFGPNGETPWQFIKAAGYTYVYAGENLAKGFKSSEGVTDAWMASPTHRENLLSGNYVDIGVAVINGTLQGEQVTLVVQMFGNPTNVVTKTPVSKPSSPTTTEKGETMSISITAPKDGEILNDANVDIEGQVTNVKGIYTVEITDKGIPLGGFESNGSGWQWDKKSDWSEGKHTVSVKLKDSKSSGDSTTFTVDTMSPALRNFDAVITSTGWKLIGEIDDIEGTIGIVSGDFTKAIKVDSNGKFEDELLQSQKGDKVFLITSDKLGNTHQTDITDFFNSSSNGKVLSTFQSIINSISQRDTLNTIFLGFILLLLLIEVVTYARKKLLAKHGGNLFTLGFWWILLLVGVVSGFGGRIN